MRRLMLLRHAKTETDAPSGRDQDRRLDERGRRDAAEIGAWLARNPPFPDLVQVSPAIRAKQTWELAWEVMKNHVRPPGIEFVPELYASDPSQMLHAIRLASISDPKQLMVVGHNPGMHELALMLTGSGDKAAREALYDNLPTSGLVVFEFSTDDWNEVSFHRGKLVLFVSPRLLKQASGH